MFYLLATVKRPDPTMMCNGLVGGLVAVSAGCAFVEPWAALLIGAVAGVLVIISVFFWDKMGVDDPVGSISMHGVAGLWGVVAVGLFATGKFGAAWNGVVRDQFVKTGVDGVRGLFYGDGGQLVAQLIEAGVLIVFGFVTAYVLFILSQLITPLRVNREAEFHGLDGTEMGTLAYPDFAMKSSTLRRLIFCMSSTSSELSVTPAATTHSPPVSWKNYAAGVAIVTAAVLLGWVSHSLGLATTNIAMIFLACVVITAVRFGRGPAITTAVLLRSRF